MKFEDSVLMKENDLSNIFKDLRDEIKRIECEELNPITRAADIVKMKMVYYDNIVKSIDWENLINHYLPIRNK